MWDGVLEFVLFTAMAGYVTNALTDRYWLCVFGGAAICSVLSLLCEAWLANWRVNIAWVPPMFQVGMILASPVIALAGLPWLLARRLRDHWREHPPTTVSLQQVQFWLAVVSVSLVPLFAIAAASTLIWRQSSSQFAMGIGVAFALTQFSVRHLAKILVPYDADSQCERKSV